MSNSLCTSNLTSGFIDLATYDEQEKYMYGGPDATAYFVRDVRRATWFTQVPVVLSRGSGMAQFGQEWSVNISRAGDYLVYAWLRAQIPAIQYTGNLVFNTQSGNPNGPNPGVPSTQGRIRWAKNLMHNLVSEVCVTFNDLVAMKIDNWFLDFWAGFTVRASKLNGYRNMIGRIDELTRPHTTAETIRSLFLNLPLPLFFSRDSGIALPTAALPYNDMKIQLSFKDFTNLLIVDELDANDALVGSRCATVNDIVGGTPQLSNVNVWANYAIVSNTERKKMGCAPRDILIEQVQTAPIQSYTPATQQNVDIRFSHAIKLLMWAVRNTTLAQCEWSNYTVSSPLVQNTTVTYETDQSFDPIANTSLFYENTQRLSRMGSDYTSLIQPWYHAPAIPDDTGLHMYSYSLSFYDVDPMGSTNYGKLTNVSIVPEASAAALLAAQGNGPAGFGYDYVQTFSFIVVGVNNNIIRISGGAMGFPVL